MKLLAVLLVLAVCGSVHSAVNIGFLSTLFTQFSKILQTVLVESSDPAKLIEELKADVEVLIEKINSELAPNAVTSRPTTTESPTTTSSVPPTSVTTGSETTITSTESVTETEATTTETTTETTTSATSTTSTTTATSRESIEQFICGEAFAEVIAPRKQRFLKLHNDYRSQIALGLFEGKERTFPKAANMLKVKWSCSLEWTVRQLANECVYIHNNYAKGENIAYYPGSDIDQQGASSIQMFIDEHKDCPDNDLVVAERECQIGHAQQMALANLREMACFSKVCDTLIDGTNGNRSLNGTYVLTVCHYDVGRYPGAKLYTEGATCSECPEGTTCEHNTGLCA